MREQLLAFVRSRLHHYAPSLLSQESSPSPSSPASFMGGQESSARAQVRGLELPHLNHPLSLLFAPFTFTIDAEKHFLLPLQALLSIRAEMADALSLPIPPPPTPQAETTPIPTAQGMTT